MLSVFRWLGRWPLWLLHAVGAPLGWLIYVASPTYRRRFDANAAQAGVSRTDARPAVAEAGRLVAELPYLWLRPPGAALRPEPVWHGMELIVAALARGHGVVMLTPHMGSFEITAQSCAERLPDGSGPVTVLYRPARNAVLRRWMDGVRTRKRLQAVPATLAGVRQMLRALRRNEVVGLLPDQVPPEGMGVWVPFFGRPAYTMTLAARLVQQTGAVPLVIWGERLARGRGYVIRVEPLGETLPDDDRGQAESAAIVNRAMERLIRQRPGQYLWGYHRYKSPRAADPTAS
jgi:Kdo2-lipid IVA lauroyltransferase/acyltransferase